MCLTWHLCVPSVENMPWLSTPRWRLLPWSWMKRCKKILSGHIRFYIHHPFLVLSLLCGVGFKMNCFQFCALIIWRGEGLLFYSHFCDILYSFHYLSKCYVSAQFQVTVTISSQNSLRISYVVKEADAECLTITPEFHSFTFFSGVLRNNSFF